MFNKIKKSLAYRLPVIYKYILRYKKLKSEHKPTTDLNVITMTGSAHIELTRLSVLSIANKWSKLPKLIIYGDGSISEKEIRANLSFWKGELEVGEWLYVKKHHIEKGRKAVLQYADINPFGKKLALILFHAAQHKTMWIDSDILFYNDFLPHIPNQNLDFLCGGSEDWLQAFDDRIVNELERNFSPDYRFNAGMLYIFGKDLYEKYNLDNMLKNIHPNYDFLTEQTIFAHIAHNSLGVIWKQNVLKNSHEDNQSTNATALNEVIARHYVSNVRHLFWRDAFLHFNYLNN